MRKQAFIFIISLLCMYGSSKAQLPSQTLRGTVVDKESKSPLPSASVMLILDSITKKSTQTETDGSFRFDNVPVGKQKIKVSYIGYQDLIMANVVVNSGKETVLYIELEEKVAQIKEATVTARKKGESVNEMTSVSTHSFNMEQTERYAGSRQDPARMASNFAGVQGNNDSRNDIVIRGNSPMGVLYRIDNVDIPNPNHFAVAGTQGGPVSILNNKVIGTSDFMTGAFPAEYGNAMAGVFDLRMRNGNNEKHEYTAQFGILGTELSGEGPISRKNKSSYLFTYRYSTLKMLAGLHINFGTSAAPNYQDASFKLNFPIGSKDNFSVFGVGGLADVYLRVSTLTEPPTELYGEDDRDQYFATKMGVVGASYSHIINNSAYMKFTLAQSVETSLAHHELVKRNPNFSLDTIYPILFYKYQQGKTSFNWFINNKINSQSTFKIGINTDMLNGTYLDSVIPDGSTTLKWQHRWDAVNQKSFMIQPYVQYKYKITDALVLNGGIHFQYFTLNNDVAVEPRVGVKWSVTEKQTLSYGFGMHSQAMPLYIYYIHRPDLPATAYTENHVGFMHSIHNVVSYENRIAADWRLLAEAYIQHLYNVPVEKKPSSFSVLNEGSLFQRFFPDTLVNKGTGDNQGIELTIEKFFSHQYLLMLTGSIFNSTYAGSDGVKRSTDFNGGFAANVLAAKEFKIGNKSSLTLGGKVTWAGGKRYSPVDTIKSKAEGIMVIVDQERNSLQFKNYFRADLKISYKINSKKLTHEIAVDLVNVFNTQNQFALTYIPNAKEPYRTEYQLGFLPLFYYKVDF